MTAEETYRAEIAEARYLEAEVRRRWDNWVLSVVLHLLEEHNGALSWDSEGVELADCKSTSFWLKGPKGASVCFSWSEDDDDANGGTLFAREFRFPDSEEDDFGLVEADDSEETHRRVLAAIDYAQNGTDPQMQEIPF